MEYNARFSVLLAESTSNAGRQESSRTVVHFAFDHQHNLPMRQEKNTLYVYDGFGVTHEGNPNPCNACYLVSRKPCKTTSARLTHQEQVHHTIV